MFICYFLSSSIDVNCFDPLILQTRSLYAFLYSIYLSTKHSLGNLEDARVQHLSHIMLWMPWMPRRRTIVATFLAIAILLTFLASSRLEYRPSWNATKQAHRKFESKWSLRTQRYPVHNFSQLPYGVLTKFPKVQASFVYETAEAKKSRRLRLNAIKQSFQHSWKGYHDHAWLSDELLPVTGGMKNSFGGWAATLVDSLDTLWIMELYDEFNEAVEAVARIDFESSDSETIHVFETTIRYLGGLLSAYQLSNQDILLQKALQLGHMLYAAFDTPSRMPIPYWRWRNALDGGDQDTIDHEISADVGSLCMEFTKLSQLSGDVRFYDAVQRISELLAAQQDKSQIPGLWPVFFNTQIKDFSSGNEFSLGALADSLYEYLPKMDIMLGGLQPIYGEMYRKAINAAKKHLFFRPMTPDNRAVLMSGVSRDGGVLDGSEQHLVCFVGGMVSMGAKLYERQADLETARRLANGCYWAYESMHSGIMPESLIAVPCSDIQNCTWDEAIWHSAVRHQGSVGANQDIREYIAEKNLPPGFASVTDGRYNLRPEAIESLFYMYRVTGEAEWQEKAWKMYQAIEEATKTSFGYSAIENVAANQLKQTNSMESFWTAETLKYLYLIFSDIDVISLDEWVFNTEAHPFRRALPSRSW